MCRMLGFRSVINSQVHASLMSAENSLVHQSNIHPDGWGVAYYMADSPHIIKSDLSAFKDNLFSKVSGIVSSQTVIAHIRKATEGEINILNTHPFQFGHWTFAHNGHIKNFSEVRDQLIKLTDKNLSRFILGSTDSELIFYIILSRIHSKIGISNHFEFYELKKLVAEAITDITEVTGELSKNDVCGAESVNQNFLSFLMTNGKTMLAHQGGKPLFFSTHKKSCPEKDTCKSYASACESRVKEGEKVMHFLISSEPVKGHNVWSELQFGQIVGVDSDMHLHLE